MIEFSHVQNIAILWKYSGFEENVFILVKNIADRKKIYHSHMCTEQVEQVLCKIPASMIN